MSKKTLTAITSSPQPSQVMTIPPTEPTAPSVPASGGARTVKSRKNRGKGKNKGKNKGKGSQRYRPEVNFDEGIRRIYHRLLGRSVSSGVVSVLNDILVYGIDKISREAEEAQYLVPRTTLMQGDIETAVRLHMNGIKPIMIFPPLCVK